MSLIAQLTSVFAGKAARAKAAELFRGMEAFQAPGEVFYVHSSGGSGSNFGNTRKLPLNSIVNALSKCVANRGDLIIVLPGHTESIIAATTLVVSKAGVTIIGEGTGTLKPTITVSTAVSAELSVTAANVTIRNLRLVCDIDSLENFFNIAASYVTLEDIDMVTSSTKEALCFVNLVTTHDFLTIRRCTAFQPTDPAGTDGNAGTGFLYCVDSEHILVEDCHLDGNFETAIIHNKTSAANGILLRNNFGRQRLAGAEITTLVSTATFYDIGGNYHLPAAADVVEATVWGTLGVGAGVSITSGVLADGAAGGQLAAPGTAVNS